MGARSKIKALPADAKARVDKFLAERARGVDEFRDWLVDELGVEIGRSSAHRYQQEFEKVAARLRQSREMAAALAQEIGPEMAGGRQGRLLVEILQNLALDHLTSRAAAGEPDTPADLMRLSRAIRDMIASLKMDAERELKVRAEARHGALEEAADNTVRAAAAEGLSAETIEKFRAAILGIEP